MERLSRTLSRDYPAIRIFLDDLESIETILRENGERFSIETEEYKFDSVKELAEKYTGRNLLEMKISSSNPHIFLYFHKTSVRLYCCSDETKAVGTFHRLDVVLNSVSFKPRFLYTFYFVWLMIGVTSLINYIPILTDSVSKPIWIIFWVVYIIWMCRLFYIRSFRSSDIRLVYRNTIQNFFTKNKDQLTVNFIIAIVSIVGTTLVTNYSSEIHILFSSLF